MATRTCKFCRKFFAGLTDLCPQCMDELDQKYKVIRDYLDRNPMSRTQDIVDGTEIDEKSVLFLIREGRLQLAGGETGLKCVGCGAEITTGRYCEACKRKFAQQVDLARRTGALPQAPSPQPKPVPSTPQSKSRMHVLSDQDRRKDR